MADAESLVVVTVVWGTKVTGRVLTPPAAEVTVIDDDGTVVATISVPSASRAPRGSVGRLVIAERVGLSVASLDDAWILNCPVASSNIACEMVTSSTKALSRMTVVEFGAVEVTRIAAGRACGSVGIIAAKNRPDTGSRVKAVVGIPTPLATRVASPAERAKTLTLALVAVVLE